MMVLLIIIETAVNSWQHSYVLMALFTILKYVAEKRDV